MASTFIRLNPTRSPAPTKLGQPSGIKQVADSMQGELHNYLGHFQKPENLMAGHNVSAHPGFKAVAADIASKRGVSKERASAMLAAGTRRAGAAARRRNPRLNRVKG